MTTDNFCFYLQNRLIQTSQTGGQWYSNTSPFSIPCLLYLFRHWYDPSQNKIPPNLFFSAEVKKKLGKRCWVLNDGFRRKCSTFIQEKWGKRDFAICLLNFFCNSQTSFYFSAHFNCNFSKFFWLLRFIYSSAHCCTFLGSLNQYKISC